MLIMYVVDSLFHSTIIGQKNHEIEIIVNTVYMGYRLLEFRSMKLVGFVITGA